MMTSKMITMVLLISLFAVLNNTAIAQEAEDTAPAVESTQPQPPSVESPHRTEPKPSSDEAAATQAMDDLLKSREAAPIIEPVEKPRTRSEPQFAAPASAAVDIDPAILGIAPGDDPPPLRREGEFIVSRRGRLIYSAESGHRLFIFESDASDTPELPLVMQACQLLETMEDTVDRRGDTTVFIISGQVHTYRGANYLLPTMMKISVDTGNLTN